MGRVYSSRHHLSHRRPGVIEQAGQLLGARLSCSKGRALTDSSRLIIRLPPRLHRGRPKKRAERQAIGTCRSRHCQPPRGRAGSGLTGEETYVNRCLTIVSREEQRDELLLRCSLHERQCGGEHIAGRKSADVLPGAALEGSDGGPAPTRTWTRNVRPAPLPTNTKSAV